MFECLSSETLNIPRRLPVSATSNDLLCSEFLDAAGLDVVSAFLLPGASLQPHAVYRGGGVPGSQHTGKANAMHMSAVEDGSLSVGSGRMDTE